MRIKRPLVSIVVPVFNGEAYIADCLCSLTNQTIENIEIIVINDASQDETGEIVCKYLMQDARIRLINHKRNMGLYVSRTEGFDLACGNYLATCDADDELLVDSIENMYKAAIEYKADLVHGRSVVLECGKKAKIVWASEPFMAETGQRYTLDIVNCSRGWNVWGKLYSRDLWNVTRNDLPHGIWLFMAEDLLLSFCTGLRAKKYKAVKDIVYRYRLPKKSYYSDSQKFQMHARDLVTVLSYIEELGQKSGIPELIPAINRMGTRMARYLRKKSPDCSQETRDEFGNLFKDNYSNATFLYWLWRYGGWKELYIIPGRARNSVF